MKPPQSSSDQIKMYSYKKHFWANKVFTDSHNIIHSIKHKVYSYMHSMYDHLLCLAEGSNPGWFTISL